LAGHFLAKYSKRMGKDVHSLGPAAQERLARYDWPGNVRELENVIQRYVALAEGSVIEDIDLPRPEAEAYSLDAGAPLRSEIPAEGVDLETVLNEHERAYILAALRQTGGNMAQAAKLLGLSYRSIRYKVKKLKVRLEGVV
jgi:two-component system response regulator PilR (NtrC family)